ncbi:hypothetical protein CASFOL_029869 [Castilleja foliolosa]|uniref:Uncharacterized protein n=1 Tax=Castilleja foliolosa TaxID=1961234 RepID=A0ABD3CBY9_9LAMI
MSTVHYAALLAIALMFQAYSITADFNIPFFSPPGNHDPCGESVCGKGNCVVSNRSNFGYACECDSGWKQARSQDDQNLMFLPCVIPNCSINYSCSSAPDPESGHKNNSGFSFLDPCFWSYCGGGKCNTTSLFTHTCLCEDGYYNLLNSSALPCYKECALGFDCASLGLGTNNSTTSRPGSGSSSADNNRSHAVSLIPRVEIGSLIVVAVNLALVLLNYG